MDDPAPLMHVQWLRLFEQWRTALSKPLTINAEQIVGGTLGVPNGGTGISSYTIGDLLYASAATTLSKLADVSAGSYLRSGGVATAPLWSTLKLPNAATSGDILKASGANVYASVAPQALTKTDDTNVTLTLGGSPTIALVNAASLTLGWTGTLSVARGGIGVGTLAAHGVLIGNGTGAIAVSAVGTTGQVLTGVTGADPIFAAPAASATSVIADDTTTNATMFPVWVTANSGSLPLKVTSTKLTFNPSTGIESATGFVASGLAALTTAAESWVGPATTTGVYFKSGFAGLGTVNPGARLHIIGNLRLTEATLAVNVNLSVSTGAVGWTAGADVPMTFGSNNAATLQIRSGGSNQQVEVKSLSGQTGACFGVTTFGGTIGDIFQIIQAGRVGIGQTAPTAILHLKAGTTAANTAPQKYTSGPLLTTAEAGAEEFLTDARYFTITTGAVRKTYAFLESPQFTTPNIGAASGTSLALTGAIGTYRNVATAGWGVPSIVGSGRSVAQTAAVASVATYTVGAADGSFLVSANVLITAYAVGGFNVQVDFTDESNVARTVTLSLSDISATINTFLAGTGPEMGIPLHLRCKASTAITVKTLGTFTSLTYNVEGSIRQIA